MPHSELVISGDASALKRDGYWIQCSNEEWIRQVASRKLCGGDDEGRTKSQSHEVTRTKRVERRSAWK